MKKLLCQLISLCLCLGLCCTCVCARENGYSFTVVSARTTQGFLELSCYCVGEISPITYLVYALNEDGTTGELLQVGEAAGGKNTLRGITVPVGEKQENYLVYVGAGNVGTPRELAVTQEGYIASYLGYLAGQTVGNIKENISSRQAVSLVRNGTPLENHDTVSPGDVVQAGEKSYTLVHFGDVNGDGAVNAKDALQILQHTVKKITLTGPYLGAADWEQDGKITAVDALNVLKFSVGKIICL